MVKITGVKEHIAHLKNISGPEMVQQLGAVLYVAASAIAIEAQISITRGAVSGKHHVRSKPGEPPKADSHFLANNIEISGEGAGSSSLKAFVTSNAPYSNDLEFGNSKIAERPFMRPALKKKTPEVKIMIRKAVAKLARGGRVI